MKLKGLYDEKYRFVKTQKKINRTCHICKEKLNYSTTFYRLNVCNHLVHKNCYKNYISNKCPRCKKEIYQRPQLQNGNYIELEDL